MPQTDPAPAVESILSALRRRQRRLSALRWGVHALLVGAVIGCVAGIALRLTGEPGIAGPLTLALAIFVSCGIIGALAGLAAPVSDLRLARALDQAAASEDRFASALQLAGHPRRDRVRLVVDDAIARVSATPAAAALPLRMPRIARWIPVPIAALLAVVMLIPQTPLEAAAPAPPDITADEWAAIHDEFKRELDQFPKPESPEEEELFRDFQALADLLRQNPDKKDALTEIAKLSDRLERQRRAAGARETSMRSAAKAIASSEALKKFASSLKQGAYTDAAGQLRKLSQNLKEGKLSPDAAEFEAISADLQRLAAEFASQDEMQQVCENASSAAGSMNREALAEALRRLAEQMEKNADKFRQCDNLGRGKSLLDMLKRRMSECSSCSGCKEGCPACLATGPRAGKGGLKPGWGSAAKWDGGSITKADEKRAPDVASVIEGPGVSTSFPIVSPDERAQSALKYEELYAEFVQKAEADLELDSVPVAYRDYLRRYFNSIRPEEAARAADGPDQESADPAP